MPVAIAALLGLQPGLVANEFLNKIPFFASVSIAFELIDFTP